MRVNYDEIAHLYEQDAPERLHGVDDDLVAVIEHSAGRVLRVLDVGCGTGSQLAANYAAGLAAAYVGVDRFVRMLRIAQERCPDVAWVHGDGMRLPLAEESFDYATSQYS